MSNTIDGIAALVSPPPASGPSKKPDELGKEDFLKLLIAQIQKQDPLNPQDPTEFTSQLTQFSSLEQLMSVNTGLNALGSINVANNRLAATSAIGRKATVSGTSLSIAAGKASPIHLSQTRDTASTTLTVHDSSGVTVAKVDLGPYAAGDHDYQWNGLDNQGRAVADGNYTFTIDGADSGGEPVTVESKFTGLVTGVTFENGTTMLQIGGNGYSMDDIVSIDSAT